MSVSSPVSFDKARLRAGALDRRNGLGPDLRKLHSIAIAERAWPIIAAAHPSAVAAFISIGSECDPSRLIRRTRWIGADVLLPVVLGRGLIFRSWPKGAALNKGPFATREPGPECPAGTPDVMLVPLAGFDRAGNRIGYGKGHYDGGIATLHREGHRPLLVGLAFSVQEVDAVPAEPHDVRLDWIVTEREAIRTGPESSGGAASVATLASD